MLTNNDHPFFSVKRLKEYVSFSTGKNMLFFMVDTIL